VVNPSDGVSLQSNCFAVASPLNAA